MKFSGKQLFDAGTPQGKIKFLINKEFESLEAAIKSLNKPEKVSAPQERTIKDWIWQTFPHLPMSFHGELPVKMSRSELGRIMDSGGLNINDTHPFSTTKLSELSFPIVKMIWFPKSKRKVIFA